MTNLRSANSASGLRTTSDRLDSPFVQSVSGWLSAQDPMASVDADGKPTKVKDKFNKAHGVPSGKPKGKAKTGSFIHDENVHEDVV